MRKKVLVIEDEKIDALRIGRAINQQFPDVSLEVLTTGEQALEWLHRYRGDEGVLCLILMDLSLPRAHGLELLSEFKRNEFAKHVPVVILSGNEDPEAVRIAYAGGASAYILKPGTGDQMYSALDSTLDFWLNVNRICLPSSGAGKGIKSDQPTAAH